jgi:hypothetical protein
VVPLPVVVSIATSGDLLQWRPHLHLLATDGGFTADGVFSALGEWGDRALMRLFRERLLARMVERHGVSQELAKQEPAALKTEEHPAGKRRCSPDLGPAHLQVLPRRPSHLPEARGQAQGDRASLMCLRWPAREIGDVTCPRATSIWRPHVLIRGGSAVRGVCVGHGVCGDAGTARGATTGLRPTSGSPSGRIIGRVSGRPTVTGITVRLPSAADRARAVQFWIVMTMLAAYAPRLVDSVAHSSVLVPLAIFVVSNVSAVLVGDVARETPSGAT